MSIQIVKSQKIFFRILNKLKLGILIDQISEFLQNRYRENSSSSLKVFFTYHNLYTHPHIRDRWYDFNAPVQWSTSKNADLMHFLSYPSPLKDDRPFMVEPNDQILTLCAYFGARKPSECLSKIPDVKQLLSEDRFKAILVGEDGLKNQFKYYFGDDFLHKVIEFPQLRTLPRYTTKSLNQKMLTETSDLIFLFLASSYRIKAVEIVIKAWLLKVPHKSKLIIACDDIPDNALEMLSNNNTITIISQAPLNPDFKDNLMRSSAVSISVTHIDGGTNATEGMEYGHAIITNDNHRKDILVGNQNGFVIPFKNKFYDMGRYGIEWDSVEEYLEIVNSDIKKGFYDESVIKLSEAFIILSERRDILKEMRIRSIEYAWSQSVQNSNQKLLEIYTNALA